MKIAGSRLIVVFFALVVCSGCFEENMKDPNEEKFVIESQNSGKDPDSISLDEEKRLLRDALLDAYPHLPPNLQSIAYKAAYFINHNWVAVTKVYMGWSAEDDPDYKPGDKRFYDPSLGIDNPNNGTIKVVFTQKFMKTLAMGELLGKTDQSLLEGARLFARAIIAHELLHAWQYHTQPVSALTTVINKTALGNAINCPNGLCDTKLLEQHKKKIEYERDAFELERKYVNPELFNRFANALDKYEVENPELFKKGGMWFLLSGKNQSPLNEYYFREKAKNKNLGREFGRLAKLTYEGQIVPPQLVYDLKRVNDSIESSDTSKMAQKETFDKILNKWTVFCEPESTQLLKRIVGPLPYLKAVNERFNLELKRFERLE